MDKRVMKAGDPIRGFMNQTGKVMAFADFCGKECVFMIRYEDNSKGPGAAVEKYQWINGAWELPDDERAVRAGRD